MLVLSRKSGEEILIGNDIRITVQRIKGSRVSIGIEASQKHRVVRGEIKATLREHNDTELPKEPL
jgi:carbon storage regulator